MSDFWMIVLLSFLGSVMALVGGVVFLLKKSWAEALERNSVPFAAGVLISVSLIGLIPEAVHGLGESAFIYVLLAFVGTYLFEQFLLGIHHHPGHRDHHKHEIAAPLVIIGDTIHNFIDGVAIAATYMMSPGLGAITTLSTFLHEVPHEIGDFGILLKIGWRRLRVFWVNVFSASFTILGATATYWFFGAGEITGILLAISAGMFLYLGASDFLPSVHEGNNKYVQLFSFLAGVAIMILTLNLVPHSHGGDLDHDHGGQHEPEGVLEWGSP